jgi:hypothetical protein
MKKKKDFVAVKFLKKRDSVTLHPPIDTPLHTMV